MRLVKEPNYNRVSICGSQSYFQTLGFKRQASHTDLKINMEAKPRPKPGPSQSRVGFVISYSFSFEVCQPNMPSITITKIPQVILASVGRENFFRSKNHPHQIFAVVAARPDVNEARVRDRTEKLQRGSVYLYQACTTTLVFHMDSTY